MQVAITNPGSEARRPLRSRGSRPIRALASGLTWAGVAPDSISVAGIGFAAGAAGSLAALPHASPPAQALLLLTAGVCVQLRLLANVLDGLVAIEGGRGSRTGLLFNEVPDRLEDGTILVAAGYAAVAAPFASELGWVCALLAIGAAYVRQVGGAAGLPQDFAGPMAKQQRMALLTAALGLSAIELVGWGYEGRVLVAALGLIAAGTAWTCLRRLRRIARGLGR